MTYGPDETDFYAEEAYVAPETYGLSIKDVLIPVLIASAPSVFFRIMVPLFEVQKDLPPVLANCAIGVFMLLELAVIVSLAFLALMRYERGQFKLNSLYPSGPPAWRRACVFLGFCLFTLADVVAAVASLPGAAFLYVGATIFYVGYIAFILLAFFGAKRKALDEWAMISFDE